MELIKDLADLLALHMPEDTILLAASRSEGRRMLAQCARHRLLVGVHAETPLSLAMELCSPLLSGQGGWKLMDEHEAAELVLECLNDPSNTGFFAGAQAKTPAAARMMYSLFQELDLACVTLAGKTAKEQQLQRLREEYLHLKKDRFLLDRADLLTKALEQLAQEPSPLQQSYYAALGCLSLKPLERKLMDALSQTHGLTLLPVGIPQGTCSPAGALEQDGLHFDPAAQLARRCRFFRCRGIVTEADFIFRDMLAQKRRAEDCAVVVLSGEYAPLLAERAGRYGIPVTISGGLPAGGSLLCHALEQTAALPESGFSAEAICTLLEQRAWYQKDVTAPLARRIRSCGIGWGDRARYQLVTQYDDPADAPEESILDGWKAFLDLLFAVASPGQKPLDDQKQELTAFLSAFTNRTLPGEAAVYSQALELAGSVSSLSPGETLLQRVLHLLQTSSYSSAGAAPGSLFCLPMAQALCTGREHLYVVGLSRYCLQGSRSCVLLPDEERLGYSGLETQDSREQENLFRFWQMVARHPGSFTFTYPDFDPGRMLTLLPAPVFQELMDALHVDEPEAVSYLAPCVLTPGDRYCQPGQITFRPPTGTWNSEAPAAPLELGKTLKDQLKDFVFSPSSLESALKCPFQFYLQKMLHLYVDRPLRRQEDRWLEKNTMGTFCHEVLENFYKDPAAPVDLANPAAKQRLEELFEQSWQAVEQNNPPTRQELMDGDRVYAMQMITDAINWTAKEGRTVLSTEQKFGGNGGLQLTVDGKNLLLSGSIDRMDQLPGGGCAILDYKTGSVEKMEREKELHLQHYLYSLAQAVLSGGQYVPDEAGYLMLENDAYYIPGDRSRDTATAQTIRALLEWLEDEEQAQQAAPTFQLTPNGTIEPAADEIRRETYRECSRYCTFKTLCPWSNEEVSK